MTAKATEGSGVWQPMDTGTPTWAVPRLAGAMVRQGMRNVVTRGTRTQCYGTRPRSLLSISPVPPHLSLHPRIQRSTAGRRRRARQHFLFERGSRDSFDLFRILVRHLHNPSVCCTRLDSRDVAEVGLLRGGQRVVREHRRRAPERSGYGPHPHSQRHTP